MISSNKVKARPKARGNAKASSIIRVFTKETSDGIPRYLVWFFFFAVLFIMTQGAIVIAPLMWLGVL